MRCARRILQHTAGCDATSKQHSCPSLPAATACRRSHLEVGVEPLLLHRVLLRQRQGLLVAGVGPQGLLGVGAAGRQVMAQGRQLLEGRQM